MAYLAVLTICPLLPSGVDLGLLHSAASSEDFLGDLWQVVAAALGVTVAVVAFAFEGFRSGGGRSYGGTLSEFAQESWLVVGVEVGIVSLLLDGVVLATAGSEGPTGVPALCAVIGSALTLVLIGSALHRVVYLLDDRSLRQLRAARVRRLLMEHQEQELISHACSRHVVPVGLTDFPSTRASVQSVVATKGGVLRDVRLTALERAAWSRPGTVIVPVRGIGTRVESGAEVARAIVPGDKTLRLARAFRIGSGEAPDPMRRLGEILDRLHGQAMHAAREGLEQEWRSIGEVYELVVGGVSGESERYGLALEESRLHDGGAGRRVASYLYEEMVAALDANQRELVGPISYMPKLLAEAAARRGDADTVRAMFSLYVELYSAVGGGQ